MKNVKIAILGLLCYSFVLSTECQDVLNANAQKVHYLEADSVIDYKPTRLHRGFFENDLRTYCYRGNPKTLARYFETIELQLEIDGVDFMQYDGATPEEVQDHHSEKRSLFSFNLFSQKRTRLQMSPFQQQCIGIETVESYRVQFHQVRIDFRRVIQLVVGVMLFLAAERLSLNSMFYYITGVVLGICLSFMLLIWLVGKLVPRRPVMYGILIGGWAIGIYIIQMLWENLQLIFLTYRTYVFWYILTTGLLSFFFCYRLGPPKNKRSKNIVKWVVQLMSLLLIYFSSHFEEASAAFIMLEIVYYYFPRVLFNKIRSVYLRRFPPKRRFLTNEEYYEEGVRETTKALEDLRTFASSPDCKQWRVMCKLRDPLRFAAFVEGASHLRDEEILKFECSKSSDEDVSDDISEISTDDQEDNSEQSSGLRYARRRHLSQSRERSALAAIKPPQPPTPEELSEEENSHGEEDGAEVATTSYRARQSLILNTSRRSMANGGNIRRSLPAHVLSQRSGSAQRIQSRSARMVSSVLGTRNARSSSNSHSFQMHQYSGESDY